MIEQSKAAGFDGNAVLVAGSFSRSFDNSKKTGKALSLDPRRVYRDFQEMAEAEAKREDGIEFVSLVTTNVYHYPIAKAFWEKGIHLVCDKPLTTELKDAEGSEAGFAMKTGSNLEPRQRVSVTGSLEDLPRSFGTSGGVL